MAGFHNGTGGLAGRDSLRYSASYDAIREKLTVARADSRAKSKLCPKEGFKMSKKEEVKKKSERRMQRNMKKTTTINMKKKKKRRAAKSNLTRQQREDRSWLRGIWAQINELKRNGEWGTR